MGCYVVIKFEFFYFEIREQKFYLTPAYIFFALTLIYYFILHVKLALSMTLYVGIKLFLVSLAAGHEYALYIAIIVFFIGWALQFIGHYYEKAKPAFVDDLGQFLIAPLFLMAEIYFWLGWEKALEEKITPMAVAKRRALSN